MAKKDFTAADKAKYSAIGAASTQDTTDTTNTETTTNTKKGKGGRRAYTRLDPRDEAPAEYRFTARMPGEYGRFLNELAYQRRSTITAELQRLVAEEMERRPEIMASLDELNE